MKISTLLFSFYFTLLIAIPTLKVVKSQFGCGSSCSKEQKNSMPKSCGKEKCILNFNFNAGQFIVEQIQYIEFSSITKIEREKALAYPEIFISNYKNNIWHPPKNGTQI
jgi:hypothetical protein